MRAPGDVRPDRLDVRREFRRLHHDRRVDVEHRIAALAGHDRRRRQQAQRVGPGPARVLSGKCRPEIPSAHAPRIASESACASTSASEWPSGPRSKGIVDAAEHEGPALDQPVRVEAVADPQAHRSQRAGRALAHDRLDDVPVAAVRHFEVLAGVRDDDHLEAGRSSRATSSVASTPSRGRFVGAAQVVEHGELRRLRGPEFARGRASLHRASPSGTTLIVSTTARRAARRCPGARPPSRRGRRPR
jgi:hypothetical protein